MYLAIATGLFVWVFIMQCLIEFPKTWIDWLLVFVVSVIVGLLWPFAIAIALVRVALYLFMDTDFSIREWLKNRRE